MALIDYSAADSVSRGSAQDGLDKLLASVSEAPRTIDAADNVTYLGHVSPGLLDAANTDERTRETD